MALFIERQIPGEEDVITNVMTEVNFRLDDDAAAVVLASINVKVDSVDTIIAGVLSNGWTGSLTGVGNGYDIRMIQPLNDYFGLMKKIAVKVSAMNALGGTIDYTYQFYTQNKPYISKVNIISQNLLEVIFSMPMTRNTDLEDVDNYTITPTSGGRVVTVKKAYAEKNVDFPRRVVLETTVMGHYDEYELVVQNIITQDGVNISA